MKKIKVILAAIIAVAGFSLISCDKEKEEVSNNWTRYQKAVDSEISKNKKNNTAILLVAFGSTWQQAFDAFDATKAAYKSAFNDTCDVYVSYSSAICINRAAAGEHKADGAEVRNYYAPNFWLHGLGAAKYDRIIVQSLQVIPGEEFSRVVNYIKDFANNSLGDLDDKYLSEVVIKLGLPLLAEETDVKNVAAKINTLYSSKATEGVVAFMGHGNPDEYDTYKANSRYNELETELQALNPNFFVGTVDAPQNFKVQVLKRMQEAGIATGTKVYLHPLMSIAGDHANNDMAGDDGKDEFGGKDATNVTFEDFGVEDVEEDEIDDLSWKWFFYKSGYECNDNTCIVKGLLELPEIRNVWINHTKEAVLLEEAYHSMYPED